MKRPHLLILYGLLWVLTIGLLMLNADFFRQLASLQGQGLAIAWFMILLGPFFFALYLLTAFLFDTRKEDITGNSLKLFLYRRRMLLVLFLFSMVMFVLLTFYGVSYKR
jgi:hypothetical protein